MTIHLGFALGTWLFAFAIALPTQAQVDGDPMRGAILYESKGCVACHGAAGLSERTEVPHIAGQQRTYLFNQIVNFRINGASARLGEKVSERHHDVMANQARQFRNGDAADVVAFLSRLPCSTGQGEPAPPRPAIATKCEFCHGMHGRSPFASFPVITGQHENYIAQQLKAFRDSAWDFWGQNSRTHRFVLAAKMDLTDTEIAGAAHYYAHLSCR